MSATANPIRLAGLSCALALTLAGCSKPASKPAAPTVVTVATVAQRDVPITVREQGRVRPVRSIAVLSRVAGQIARVAVHDGQTVHAGQLLFVLDPRQARAALDQARANLARDRAQAAIARDTLRRQTPLAKDGYVSQQQLRQSRDNLTAAEATVQADRANVADLTTQLDYTRIRAPIDGRLGTIALKLGASVPANGSTPLVTINQMQPIDVSLPLAQRQLPALQAAMARGTIAARVALPDGAGTIDGGHLAYIDNQIDAATSTIAVYARFPNRDERLWPGEYVEASLELGIEPKALVAPASAVQTGQDGDYVFRLESGQRVHRVPVTVRRSEGDLDVVAGRLAPGDRVVTSGQLRLRDGSRVEIRATGTHRARSP